MTHEIRIAGQPLEDAVNTINKLLADVKAQTYAIADSLRDTADELADLPPICTGHPYWRDNKSSQLLYANHGVNRSCPIHGTPDPGKRLRSYIGANRDTQAAALADIDRAATLHDLQEQIRQHTLALQAAHRELHTILHAFKHPTRAPWLW